MKNRTIKGKFKDNIWELINSDGSLVEKGWTDSVSQISTNKLNWDDSEIEDEDYPNPPQTTDDYADEIGQGRRLFYAYGYGVKEGVDLNEVIYDNKPDTDLNSKRGIPDLEELSNSYNSDSVQAKVVSLVSDINSKIESQGSDILSIVLKAILTGTTSGKVTPAYKKELMNILNGKK